MDGRSSTQGEEPTPETAARLAEGPDPETAAPPAAATEAPADEQLRERVREGVTMALYISLSLLAVILALPSGVLAGSPVGPAVVIALTSLGLILAHAFAFRLSARLVGHGRIEARQADVLAAQLIGGGIVTLVATAPVLLLGTPLGMNAAAFLLVAFIALVGYAAARRAPMSRLRALAYVATVVVAALVVLGLKGLVGH